MKFYFWLSFHKQELSSNVHAFQHPINKKQYYVQRTWLEFGGNKLLRTQHKPVEIILRLFSVAIEKCQVDFNSADLDKANNQPHIANTYVALVMLLILGDNLQDIRREAVGESLRKWQLEDSVTGQVTGCSWWMDPSFFFSPLLHKWTPGVWFSNYVFLYFYLQYI